MENKIIVIYGKEILFANGMKDSDETIIEKLIKAGILNFDIIKTPLDIDTFRLVFLYNQI